jgi:hypothetical protein
MGVSVSAGTRSASSIGDKARAAAGAAAVAVTVSGAPAVDASVASSGCTLAAAPLVKRAACSAH